MWLFLEPSGSWTSPTFLLGCCHWISGRLVSFWALGSTGSWGKPKLGDSGRIWDLRGHRQGSGTGLGGRGRLTTGALGPQVGHAFRIMDFVHWESGEPLSISSSASHPNKPKILSKVLHGQLFGCLLLDVPQGGDSPLLEAALVLVQLFLLLH